MDYHNYFTTVHLLMKTGVSGKSVILLTQYTGTSSTDFTVDSVVRLSVKRGSCMYSARVPVPQGYHITVTDSFSPVKWYTLGRGTIPLVIWVPGGTRFEGVPNHRDTGFVDFHMRWALLRYVSVNSYKFMQS